MAALAVVTNVKKCDANNLSEAQKKFCRGFDSIGAALAAGVIAGIKLCP